MSHIRLITGKLAEPSVRKMAQRLADEWRVSCTVEVLPITVAALMTAKWVARHSAPCGEEESSALVCGYCQGDLEIVEQAIGMPVRRGPKDVGELPAFLGLEPAAQRPPDYGPYSIEILAEINHAPRLSPPEILATARRMADDGADIIDIGCDPGDTWTGIADCVRQLRDEGLRVSVDSLNRIEIEAAVRAGAELVLSVNSSNREAAVDWGSEVVVIPDHPHTLDQFDETIAALQAAHVPLRLDPILEPIGIGFAASLHRYWQTRHRFPEQAMLMGIGNLTELTDADSAAINVLLLGLCAELSIGSVLTTEVISWARTSIRECHAARQLVDYATRHAVPPKHLAPELIMLRDPAVVQRDTSELAELASRIRDSNYRIFAEAGQLHLVGRQFHHISRDPFALFKQLLGQQPQNLDAEHVFYLGYEMAKAQIALTLGKQYRQDEPLRWGLAE